MIIPASVQLKPPIRFSFLVVDKKVWFVLGVGVQHIKIQIIEGVWVVVVVGTRRHGVIIPNCRLVRGLRSPLGAAGGETERWRSQESRQCSE